MTTERVQIPAYTDRWMMGDRYGDLIKVTKALDRAHHEREIAHVRLDVSGKTMRFLLADCTLV